LKRHLSEVLRPSGDIIGWSPVHPLQGFPGFTSPGTFRPRAFSAPRRFAPPPTRLPYSMQAPPMGFREPDLHHPSGLTPEDGGAWPSPSSMAALPKLNCNVRRSALESGPKPHFRLEPDATPRKRGTRTGRYADFRGVQPTRPILEEAARGAATPKRAPRPETRLECGAETRSRFGSTRSASDRSRGVRRSTLTSRNGSAMPVRSEATGPSQHPDRNRAARSGHPAREAQS